MRLFVAADISEEIRARINGLMEPWRKERVVKWVPPHNLHITLYFLGHLEESCVSELQRVGEAAVEGETPFPVQVEGVSAFPSLRSPRVFWVGVSDDGRLKDVYTTLKEELKISSLQVPLDERDYVPHITVGRVKQRCPSSLLQRVERSAGAVFGGCTVDHLTLFRSELSPKGAVYQPVLRWRL